MPYIKVIFLEKRSYKLLGTPDCPISVYTRVRTTVSTRRHPEVELITLHSGTLHCRLDNKEITLAPGDILIINPNQLHAITGFPDGQRHFNVIFSLEAISMPQSHPFQKNFVAPLSEGRLLLPNLLQKSHPAYDTVHSILAQLPQGNPHTEEIKVFRYTRIIALCAALMPYCTHNQMEMPQQSPEDLTVRQVMIHIHFHYNKPLTLSLLASHVHLHPNYLCKLFKSYTGQTIIEHLTQTRVEAAKFLLRRDSLPMTRVAELTGFPSERAFYRSFKQVTGITPKAYQKQQVLAAADIFEPHF